MENSTLVPFLIISPFSYIVYFIVPFKLHSLILNSNDENKIKKKVITTVLLISVSSKFIFV